MTTPATRPRVNRVLGATSGPFQGNVQAILAIILTAGFLALFGFLAVEYLAFGHDAAQALVQQAWGAIQAAFGLVVGLYFGARTAQTGTNPPPLPDEPQPAPPAPPVTPPSPPWPQKSNPAE